MGTWSIEGTRETKETEVNGIRRGIWTYAVQMETENIFLAVRLQQLGQVRLQQLGLESTQLVSEIWETRESHEILLDGPHDNVQYIITMRFSFCYKI